MLDRHAGLDPLADLQPVTDAETVRDLIRTARAVYASPAVKEYVVEIVARDPLHSRPAAGRLAPVGPPPGAGGQGERGDGGA